MKDFFRRFLGRGISSPNLPEKRIDELFVRFDLCCVDFQSVQGDRHIPSFAHPEIVYRVSLSNQTCTCPDFFHRRGFHANTYSRWCKHLMLALSDAGAFENISEWHKAIVDTGHGGPLGAFTVRTEKSQVFMVTAGLNSDWINVLGRTRKKGEKSHLASGPIRQYGWCISEQRWSYGEGPPGARELRRLMVQIEKIEHF